MALSFSFVALVTIASSFLSRQAIAAPSAVDPCINVAGKAFVPPADALACYKAFAFNESLRQNVLTNAARVLDFYTFEDYYLNSLPPFEESTIDIREKIAQLNGTSYPTDYDFNKDLYDFTTQLNDGHTRWYPYCYTVYQSILPTPLISIEVDGEQGVYVAFDARDVISQLPPAYESYFDGLGFDWKRLQGARILQIEGQDPYDYVDTIARTVSGNYLDHGIRVNSVFTSYRISGTAFSQRLGDLAGPIDVSKTSLTFKLVPVNSTVEETVKVPYLAAYTGAPFTDTASFWAANCAVKTSTNGVDLKASSTTDERRHPRYPKGNIIDLSHSNAIALPPQYVPTLTSVAGSGGVIKSYVLPDNETGVMFVGSFEPANFNAFQADVANAINDFKSKGIIQLLIDLTNNGAKKILKADIKQGLDNSLVGYTADNYATLTGKRMSASYDYLTPSLPVIVNGRSDPTSQRFHDTCTSYFSQKTPSTPPFDLSKVAIVSNGNCASTCAMFSTLMYEQHNTTIAVFGGKPGQNIEFKGMAGNQVLEWVDLDTEIKTAGVKNDPLAPPDLLVAGNFRHNWRTAYSYVDNKKPIAYISELPLQFPYTKDTYNNPQNLWIFA
ncbi:hypothetical protein H0H92_012459 [Tricholoma furcatifolium]|nr:hypothetical protein H0H92_012459 [Tricholoma furcatifolium]